MSVDLEGLEPESESESGSGLGYLERLLAGPGVSLLTMAVVSLATWTGIQAGNADPFVLQAPITEDWWQLPLSVFAHSNMSHLVGNATVIAIAGSVVVLSSSPVRYHTFFLASGMLAGAAQLSATGFLGEAVGGLGASGAAMALVGYTLTSNSISSWILEKTSRWVVGIVILGVGLLLTIRTAGVAIGNVAHLVGAMIGLAAGHFNLLRAR